MTLSTILGGLPFNGTTSGFLPGSGLSATLPGLTPPVQPNSAVSVPPGTRIPTTSASGAVGVIPFAPNTSAKLPNLMSALPTVAPSIAAQFDSKTMQGVISPALSPNYVHTFANGTTSFSGSDCRVMIEVQTPAGNNTAPRIAKQFLELTTISVSVHRSKAQVPAASYINPKGVARGRRTIAGTMILTKFVADALIRFLQSGMIGDTSKDTTYSKIDQLPPFNLTLLFFNEYGYESYQRILGIELVTDGSTYSIQDMLSEQTISYIAADFTPLLPITSDGKYIPADSANPSTVAQKTVASVWTKASPSLLPSQTQSNPISNPFS